MNRTPKFAAAGTTAALVFLAALLWSSRSGSGAFVHDDPSSVATAFLYRHDTGDPAVCELAAEELRSRLDREGRCSGTPSDSRPVIEVLHVTTCGDRSGLDLKLDRSGVRYAHVGLRKHGDRWLVQSYLPIEDATAIRGYSCAFTSTRGGA